MADPLFHTENDFRVPYVRGTDCARQLKHFSFNSSELWGCLPQDCFSILYGFENTFLGVQLRYWYFLKAPQGILMQNHNLESLLVIF